jgi:beta-glucanase (GH16 family)
VIFNENFNTFNKKVWKQEITMSGGGVSLFNSALSQSAPSDNILFLLQNWEFQIYDNDTTNCHVQDGYLYLTPTFTEDKYGPGFIETQELDLGAACTNDKNFGCKRSGGNGNIINPIISARISTDSKFSFKYGLVEVRAKIPT